MDNQFPFRPPQPRLFLAGEPDDEPLTHIGAAKVPPKDADRYVMPMASATA